MVLALFGQLSIQFGAALLDLCFGVLAEAILLTQRGLEQQTLARRDLLMNEGLDGARHAIRIMNVSKKLASARLPGNSVLSGLVAPERGTGARMSFMPTQVS